MRGPLLALSRSARWALGWCGVLACLNAGALVVLALALASAVTGDKAALPLLVGAVVARAVLAWATESAAARAAAGAKEELRSLLLDRALGRGPEWISERGPAELTVLATKGLDALDAYFTRYLPALVTAVVVPPIVGAWILFTDWPSAVLVAVTLPLIPVFAILVGWYTSQRVQRAAEVTERLSGYLLELLRALPVLTVFGRASAQASAVRLVGEEHRRATMGTLRVAFLSALVLEIAASLSVALIAVGVGLRLVSGELTLVTALVVLILAPECYLPLRAAGAAHHASEDGLEAVRRVAEIVGKPTPRSPDGEQPPPFPGGDPEASLPMGGAPEGDVDLACGQSGCLWTTCDHDGRNLTITAVQRVKVENLRVRRRGRWAPDRESFEVVSGNIHRLDAPSGAGKSTTLSVLLGFVTPDEGTVLVDGVDLSTMDMSTWRRSVAWVPQRPAFAGATVTDELELTEPTATREEMIEVAKKVAADHLLDRRITELSTGERQRVAVTRALLHVKHGATVLLLDEPTAHLDAATATKVNKAIRDAADNGAVVLLATHRVAEDTRDESTPTTSQTAHEPEHTTASPHRLLTKRSLAGAALGVAALAAGVALSAAAAYLIAKAAEQPPILTLTVLIVGVRTFALSKGVLRYTERLVSHDAAFRLAINLRTNLWQAMVRRGPARLQKDSLQRLVDDTDTVRDLVPRVLLPPIVAIGVGLGTVVLFAAINPSAAAALAIALLVGGLAAPAIAVAVERRASAALSENRRKITADVLTLLTAAPDLIAAGAHRIKRADLARQDAELARLARRQAFGAGAATAVVHLTTGGAALVCSALATGLTAPVLGLVPLALAEALIALPLAAQQLSTLRAAQARLVIDTVEEPEPKRGDRIRLDHVDVRWPGATEPALRDVDLDIEPGTHVAVVGPSGAGKSTLFALLLGFLHPEKGIAELPRATWCPQEAQLVSTTVRENLLMSGPHDDERLREALRLAGLPEWTDRLDVVVKTDQLSGGEAQRLALARALLHDADVVLLDEPTAHLDEPTARALLDRLAQDGRTVVHITHRPDEAARADLVLEIDSGRVRERAYR